MPEDKNTPPPPPPAPTPRETFADQPPLIKNDPPLKPNN